MDFADLGGFCSYYLCGRQDYLPFKCDDGCGQIFCLEHRTQTSHECKTLSETNQTNDKPSAQQQNPSSASKGTHPATSTKTSVEPSNVLHRCQATVTMSTMTKRCKTKDYDPLLCPGCKLHHCLAHRFPQDHNCSSLVRNNKNSQTSTSTSMAKQPRSSDASVAAGAAALARMKLSIENTSLPSSQQSVPQTSSANSSSSTSIPTTSATQSSTGTHTTNDHEKHANGDEAGAHGLDASQYEDSSSASQLKTAPPTVKTPA